jgi:DNA-binding NarL/FixJ family response regulator
VVNRSGCDFSDELDFARAIQPSLCLLDMTGGTEDVPCQAQQEAAVRLRLTSREVDVLRCLLAGLTVEAIGRQLRISGRTVRKHLENAYRELDCHDRLMAVTAARWASVVV